MRRACIPLLLLAIFAGCLGEAPGAAPGPDAAAPPASGLVETALQAEGALWTAPAAP